jgi:hypothetical protein
MFALPGYGQADMENKVQLLTDALNRAQDQLSQAQVQLQDLRRQIADLREQVSTAAESASASAEQQRLSSQVEALKENQELQASEIATHEQAKVESESKYPVKVTGMVLLNGFVNTNGVDMPATPTVALGGAGTTGASLRQTVLGLDLLGPHLFGGQSHADVRADFFGSTGSSNNGAYNAVGLLRLRTAHAALAWDNTEAWFSLDRPMVSANEPASLTAVAVPPLSWSGNLWTWNPQAGITRDFGASSAERVRIQGALIDVSDPPYAANASPPPPNKAGGQGSRRAWPSVPRRARAFVSEQADTSRRIAQSMAGNTIHGRERWTIASRCRAGCSSAATSIVERPWEGWAAEHTKTTGYARTWMIPAYSISGRSTRRAVGRS